MAQVHDRYQYLCIKTANIVRGENRGTNQWSLRSHPRPGCACVWGSPEVAVHAAEDRKPIFVGPDSLFVDPGASHVLAELVHHRWGKGVLPSQQVSRCTEPSGPRPHHRHPQPAQPSHAVEEQSIQLHSIHCIHQSPLSFCSGLQGG